MTGDQTLGKWVTQYHHSVCGQYVTALGTNCPYASYAGSYVQNLQKHT